MCTSTYVYTHNNTEIIFVCFIGRRNVDKTVVS